MGVDDTSEIPLQSTMNFQNRELWFILHKGAGFSKCQNLKMNPISNHKGCNVHH